MLELLHGDFNYSYSSSMDPAQTVTTSIVSVVVYIIVVIALWRVFTKSGHAGWLAIIPIVNTIVLIKISGHSGWSIFLYLIPIVNIIWSIVVAIGVARNFGKSGAFGFFLVWLLSIIGYLILGFGGAKYTNPKVVTAAA